MTEKTFDTAKWDQVASNFYTATGVKCIAAKMTDAGNEASTNASICCALQDEFGTLGRCAREHCIAAAMANSLGGQYIFMCAIGLCHFISPIKEQDEMVGYLLGGPVLMSDKEDFLYSDLVAKSKYREQMRAMIDELTVCSPERLSSLANMLEYLSQYIKFDTGLSEKRQLIEQQSDISEYIHENKERETTGYPINLEDSLIAAIELGEEARAKRLLNDLLGYIYFSSGNNFSTIKNRVTELVVLLSRSAVRGGADPKIIFGMSDHYINEVGNFNSLDQLSRWLSRAINKFSTRVIEANGSRAGSLAPALKYIRENVTKKLTLEEVAATVYLTPSYFSRTFSATMDSTFTEYVMKLRVELAKKLLLNEHLTLVDVSSLSGFQDQSYFTKTFKAFTGNTPKQYKSEKGRIIREAN